MAVVLPFRGILYSDDIELGEVVAPPYDIITPKERDKLKDNRFNIVHIILPDSYKEALEILSSWVDTGLLGFDKECSFYGYRCDYGRGVMKGLIGALRVEPFGGAVRPHEKTLSGPKIDRFNLITSTHAMFCPIMGLYEDKDNLLGRIMEPCEPREFVFEGLKHALWKIGDGETIDGIKRFFSEKDIIIADGHHRYETILMLKDYYVSKGIEHGGFEYVLCFLVDKDRGGLKLNAIHRGIKGIGNVDDFLKRLNRSFDFVEGNLADFDVYCGSGVYHGLRFKRSRPSDPVGSLGVSILERYVLMDLLGFSEDDIMAQRGVVYAHSREELEVMVDDGTVDIGFLMKPMRYDEFSRIVKSGLMVPQKSTFFSPKVPSGIVGYHFRSVEGCDV